MPEGEWVFALGMDDWRRRGIGESLVSCFGHSESQDAPSSAEVDAAGTGSSDDIGTIEQDWTRLPAGPDVGRELRDPQVILVALTSTPVELGRMLEEAPSDALTQPSPDGGAAVVEIVAHQRDWEAVVDGWITRMRADDEPPLLEVPDDSLWAIEHDYAAEDPHRAFADFADLRASLISQVSDLDAAIWSRSGSLDGDGPRTVLQILNMLCDRDADHLQRVREALA